MSSSLVTVVTELWWRGQLGWRKKMPNLLTSCYHGSKTRNDKTDHHQGWWWTEKGFQAELHPTQPLCVRKSNRPEVKEDSLSPNPVTEFTPALWELFSHKNNQTKQKVCFSKTSLQGGDVRVCRFVWTAGKGLHSSGLQRPEAVGPPPFRTVLPLYTDKRASPGQK